MVSHGRRAICIAIAASRPRSRRRLAYLSDATKDHRPVVLISRDGVVPRRLEVHVGEVVGWGAVPGGRLRPELDRHPTAHEVVERCDEARGVSRKSEEHWYVGRLLDDGDTAFSGVIVVGAERGADTTAGAHLPRGWIRRRVRRRARRRANSS